MNLLYFLFNECGNTLSITRKTSSTIITAAGFNTNYDEIEAVVNGGINDTDNIAADGVGKTALNSNVVNANNGLVQETDGSLSVDPSDTNPCLELSDGGLRVIADGSTIERTASGLGIVAGGVGASQLASNALAAAWPIGSIFISAVSTNPNTLLGFGTWSAFGAGKVLVGLDSGDSDFDTVEETGGAKTNTFDFSGNTDGAESGGGGAVKVNTLATEHYHPFSGTTDAGSIVQPYIVVYMWKRTA